MTAAERKIEAALETHFRALGFSIDVVNGDHVAELYEEDDESELPHLNAQYVNLTLCAKFVAEEIGA